MTRIDTPRLAVAAFLLSEAVFFGFLIAAYVYFYPASSGTARNNLDPPRTLIFTICLLASSATMWVADRRLRADRRNGFRLWLGVTIALGAIFLAGQGVEYAGLLSRAITPERNLFGATFFTLTGFHGFHVLCGLVSLGALMALTFRSTLGESARRGVGAVSLYWHFVDAIWIVIFSLVYLTVWL